MEKKILLKATTADADNSHIFRESQKDLLCKNEDLADSQEILFPLKT